MYKLTILFFFLTAFNNIGLMDSYHLKFSNENATYTLQIKEGSLVMDNQPNVTVTGIVENNLANDTDKSFDATEEQPFDATQGRVYKITKGTTFEDGLKIGGDDATDVDKIGGDDATDVDREMNALLFGIKEHQAYEIVLSYALVTVVEKSSNVKQQFAIEDGVYLIISDDKFAFLR